MDGVDVLIQRHVGNSAEVGDLPAARLPDAARTRPGVVMAMATLKVAADCGHGSCPRLRDRAKRLVLHKIHGHSRPGKDRARGCVWRPCRCTHASDEAVDAPGKTAEDLDQDCQAYQRARALEDSNRSLCQGTRFKLK